MAPAVDQQTLPTETLEELRRAVAELSDRVAAIESALAVKAPEARDRDGAALSRRTPKTADGVSPEILAAICAALAAHLGVRPHIRQISLVAGGAWAQQGRVTIQASHALAIQRD